MGLFRKTKFKVSTVYIFIEMIFTAFFTFALFKDSAYVWLWLSEIILLAITIINRKKVESFFSPLSIFLIACHLSFSVKGINILETGKFTGDDVKTAILWYILFLAGILISLSIKTKSKVLSAYNHVGDRKINYSKLKIFAIVFLPICLFAYFTSLGTTDLNIIFSNLLSNRVAMQNDGGLYVQTLITLPLKIVTYALFAKILTGKKDLTSKISFTIFFIVLEIIAFSLGGRGEIIFPILALIFIYEKTKTKIDYKKFIIIFLAIIAFSGWYGLVRDGAERNSINTNSTIQNVLDRYVQLDNLIRFSSEPIEVKVGQSFYDFVFSPIPRSVMPNKTYPFNSQMTNIYLPEQFSRKIVSDFTAISELYYNFSYIGIFIGGLIFGLILNYLSHLFISDKRIFFLMFYPFLMLKPMSIFYGGMINSTANMMLILEIVLFIIVWYFITDGTKSIKKVAT